MELSLKSEYAILALVELATHFELDQPLQIRQIASQQNIPDRYLEQLLATLRRHGLVKSQRGSKGGYILAREPWRINVLEIIHCMEGKDPTMGDDRLSNEAEKTPTASVVHNMWQSAQTAAANVLKNCTLKDLCEQEKQFKLSTAMYYI
ncbi:rrf2 family protein, putative transcriptional regulator [Synechococcus sp. PCC 7502]|uniref:RrF2 family transcriptional regulator n=1 Tax=Synechococcus sp. PCC 7502 TaxID=1173263 RepID=UPI00029FE820|nr:Rrf2 family transcriptional regulator [Synechococcus sp. PCC 7502]AFY73904.1 rrf2 family protein, putative transcriptional regulator [Synechococcus sp. PCC 7502]